jgi:hypothetical protein
MAWTAPLTAVDGLEFTASQYNTYIRDNMLEMAVAKATTVSQYFTSEGANKVSPRQAKSSVVATSETYGSTEFGDLATHGPEVTVVHGEVAMVFIAASMANSAADTQSVASFAVVGASSISPHDSWKIKVDGTPADQTSRFSMCRLVKLKTPGTSTFTMKYRRGGAEGVTGTFANREICVLPL